jgi:hypothetical protein
MFRPLTGSPGAPSAGAPFGIFRIRERAGSVFSPKRRERRNTTATHRSGGTLVSDAGGEMGEKRKDEELAGGGPRVGSGDGGGNGWGSGGGTPTKSNGRGLFGRLRGSSNAEGENGGRDGEKAGEGEEAVLGRDLGSGQNMAPPEPPRM